MKEKQTVQKKLYFEKQINGKNEHVYICLFYFSFYQKHDIEHRDEVDMSWEIQKKKIKEKWETTPSTKNFQAYQIFIMLCFHVKWFFHATFVLEWLIFKYIVFSGVTQHNTYNNTISSIFRLVYLFFVSIEMGTV